MHSDVEWTNHISGRNNACESVPPTGVGSLGILEASAERERQRLSRSGVPRIGRAAPLVVSKAVTFARGSPPPRPPDPD